MFAVKVRLGPSSSIRLVPPGFTSATSSDKKPQSNKGQEVQRCVSPSNMQTVQEY